MDYTVHGVAKTWTRLSDFHFFLSFNLILRLWLAVVPHAVVGLQTRVCPAVISGHALIEIFIYFLIVALFCLEIL